MGAYQLWWETLLGRVADNDYMFVSGTEGVDGDNKVEYKQVVPEDAEVRGEWLVERLKHNREGIDTLVKDWMQACIDGSYKSGNPGVWLMLAANGACKIEMKADLYNDGNDMTYRNHITFIIADLD